MCCVEDVVQNQPVDQHAHQLTLVTDAQLLSHGFQSPTHVLASVSETVAEGLMETTSHAVDAMSMQPVQMEFYGTCDLALRVLYGMIISEDVSGPPQHVVLVHVQ